MINSKTQDPDLVKAITANSRLSSLINEPLGLNNVSITCNIHTAIEGLIDYSKRTGQVVHKLKSNYEAFELVNKKIDDGFEAVNKKFEAIDEKFKAVDARFEAMDKKIDDGFKAVNKKFEAIDEKFKAVDARFEAMDKKIDDGFNEMKIYLGNMQNNLSKSLITALTQTFSNSNNGSFQMVDAK